MNTNRIKIIVAIAVILTIAVASFPSITAKPIPGCVPDPLDPLADSDGDGISDCDEDLIGSDPCDPDSPHPSTVNLNIAKLYASKTEYYRGETVKVHYHIKNVGTVDADEYQVVYKIVDPNGKVVSENLGRKRTIAAGKEEKLHANWQIPAHAVSGKYIVKATLAWDSKSAKKTATFIVTPGYTEDEIDKLLDDKVIIPWFRDQTKDIKTETSFGLTFLWQHLVAFLKDGFSGNSPDFVDKHKYGRCGHSMVWLENHLAKKLGMSEDSKERQQAMLSITGEKYYIFDHTALLIRPKGITNSEWANIVQTLVAKSLKKEGLKKADIRQLNPRLLNARVLDPYYKKTRTVEEFIKDRSTIRIS